mmetsp:Transcript_4711/g.6012  ORF Transcript_4711/g.6012 Transcript_4711/m.6012 type:complete len:168 (+) Transcript_4711:62-565(+)
MWGTGVLSRHTPSMVKAIDGAPDASADRSGDSADLQLASAPSSQLQALQQQLPEWQLRQIVREEFALQSQAHARPMQLIINNHAQANSDQRTMNVQQAPPEGYKRDNDLRTGVMNFLASPLNRIFLFSTVGLSLYALHGHLNHTWRMEEMQRKMDANILYRVRGLLR